MEPSSDEDEDALCVVIDAAPPQKKAKLDYKRWKCAECPKAYSQKGNLDRHIKIKHSATPPSFACGECDKTFTRRYQLDTHIKTKHSATPPSFTCDECGKTYTEKGHLNTHIKTKHSATPPSFACDECGKTFTQKGVLDRHIKAKHSATPPSFACVQCNKTFTQKGHLKEHLAFAHDVGVVWHHCDADPDCDYKAKTGGNLARHIQSMHARVFAQRKQEQEEKVRGARAPRLPLGRLALVE